MSRVLREVLFGIIENKQRHSSHVLILYYRLNACVPAKFICWNLTLSVMVFGDGAFGKWLDHKNGALMKRISSLIKQTPEISLAPFTM